ncbi:MAG: type II toxin-antitoxin system RelE/ParE family toxin [Oscillospiraceae bacterium]|nr:type II toxin-antitoxin system RelE/ParE family toxin [Oscillospiraceae bacterium]
MYKVDVSDRAETDLDRIIEYITVKLSAPKAASDLLDKVYDCYSNLEKNPYVYETCRDSRLKSEGYRRAVINNYIMIYKVYEDTKDVIVHDFFYGGQDYTTLIL